MFEWSDARQFLAVQRTKSLTAAARVLKVNQSTVSRRIAALEDTLGARLFDRTPDGLVLTTVGERIYDAARRMEEAALAVERTASGEDAKVEGPIRLATSEAFAVGFLMDHLAELRRKHPALSIEVGVGQPSVDLSRREADVALRFRPRGTAPAQPNLIARRLGGMAFAAFASRAYLARRGTPRRAGDLDGHDVIAYDEDLPPIPGASWLREAAGNAGAVTRCTSILALAAAARGNLGVTVMPCFLGMRRPALVRLTPPATIDYADIWVVIHPDLRGNARVRAVMDWLAELIVREKRVLEGDDESRSSD
jgi:DNA-binding transcriptional LysR family regulator